MAKRYSQPQSGAQIDWSNPLTRGLQIARVGNKNVDLVSNANPVSGTVSTAVGKQGVAASYTAASSDGHKYASGNLATGPMTVFALCMRRGQNANWLRLYSDTDGALASIDIRNPANTDNLVFSVNGPSANQKTNTAVGFFTGSDGATLRIAATYNGQFTSTGSSDFQFYKDGVAQSSGLDFAASGSPAARSNYSMFGNYALNPTGIPRAWNGDIYLGLVWNRALSDAEIKSISDNPWQLFRAANSPIFVPVAGGSPTVISDSTASYLIREAVTADLSAAYSLRETVTSDATASYLLRTAATSDTSASYAIAAPVTSDTSASYSILTAGAVTSDSSASYSIRGVVQSDASIAYELRGAVQSTLSGGYDIRQAVASDTSAAYAVTSLAVVTSDLAAAYAVTGVAGLSEADIAAIWAYGVRTITGPTAADIAAAVIALAQTTPIQADLRRVTGQAINGAGTEANPWGP